MTIFSSFQSTVNRFVRGRRAADFHVLEDPITGAPAGLQSRGANGPDGIWAPVQVTAAQIASPSTLMIADLNATFQLNVAPYSRYRSDGSTLVEMAATSDAPVFTGPVTIGAPATTGAILTTNNSATQISADQHFNDFTSTSTYTADSAGGANLGLVSTMYIYGGGHHYSATHSAAVYGTISLADTNAASVVDQINGVAGAAGNAGAGTLTRAVAFYAHQSFNTGGGTLTNEYAIYHDTPTGAFGNSPATNGYGFYINAPSGIGTSQPTAYLDIRSTNALGSTTLFRARSSGGDVFKLTADGVVTGASGVNSAGVTILYAPLTITAARAPFSVLSTVSVRALPA